ncbi:MAG: Rv0909 family putative TA system antitoxin [Dermatophilaceae bacterium]
MARRTAKLTALAGLAKAAQDYVRKNPHQVSSAIDRVESTVGRRAGTRHGAKVAKGGQALRKGLGLPPSGGSGSVGWTGGSTTPPPPPPSTTPPPPPPRH